MAQSISPGQQEMWVRVQPGTTALIATKRRYESLQPHYSWLQENEQNSSGVTFRNFDTHIRNRDPFICLCLHEDP